MLKRHTALLTLAVTAASMAMLTACGNGVEVASVRGGAVPLDRIRLGTPENIFKEAYVTFGEDPNGTAAGKHQYLSHMPDQDGGQYVVGVKDEHCYELSVLHNTKPVAREVALKKMENLLPADVVANNKPEVQQDPAKPVETYVWGKKYRTQMLYTDQTKQMVSVVNAAQAL
jgi:hypothetical protein